MKTVYIAWANYQRRAVSMQKYLSFDLFHIAPNAGGFLSKLMGYVRQSILTLQIVHRSKPDVVWIQLPPNFIVHILVLVRTLTRTRFKIVLDCHNASLRAPWLSTPLFALACRASDLLIVHNEEVLQQIPPALVGGHTSIVVLEDPPSSFENETPDLPLENFVLVPCSFHDDEPIEMVLAAARLLPSVEFRITGSLEKARAKGYLRNPQPNVVFTGFLSEFEFNRLLHSSAVVAGITTYEGIQLSVASEAIGAGKALILSGTRVLRQMFEDCAVFFENNEVDFSDAVLNAIRDRPRMELLASESLERRVIAWQSKAITIEVEINQPTTDKSTHSTRGA